MLGFSGAFGIVALRLGLAALVLALIWRPRLPTDRRTLGLVCAFGSAIAGMNTIYLVMQYFPLGIAISLQLLGPVALALITSRRLVDLSWSALAGVGVMLFGIRGGQADGLPLAGLLLAALSAGSWAVYLLLSKRATSRDSDSSLLCLALCWGALLYLPVGVIESGTTLVQPKILLFAFGVAVLSAAIPYSLDLAALRKLPPRMVGVLQSLEPAFAGVAGLFILGEFLPLQHWLGILCVTAASIGAVMANSYPRRWHGNRERVPPHPPLRSE
ncbi:EamA family transporter [Amycolatopsis anabasis]|uniref:EamA family transporter n=1 Tax=Amycolatopsis anabasis TaxID=1840409 RepID=UPI00131E9FF9|nr:EamA family transporter [Amycolatopsis anabasis]